MAKKRSQADIEAAFTAWLAAGGEKKMSEAVARARATSEGFARATRVRTETLYEPVAF